MKNFLAIGLLTFEFNGFEFESALDTRAFMPRFDKFKNQYSRGWHLDGLFIHMKWTKRLK